MLYEQAGEPKTLKLFEGADHRMNPVSEALFELVADWVDANV